MITINIRPRGNPIKNLPESLDLDLAKGTVEEALYLPIAKITGLDVHRLRITKGSDGRVVSCKTNDDRLVTVEETGLRDGSQIFVKDLGPQMDWRTVFLIEYAGPLLIHPLCLALRPYIYTASKYNPLSYIPFNVSIPEGAPIAPLSKVQVVLYILTMLHFFKREYETMFVHRFSVSTMPFVNIFRNSAHYWILSGFFLAYAFYSPFGPTASWWPAALNAEKNPTVLYGCVALWAWSQLSNYFTHLTLRDLRPVDGSKKRRIPKGYGFNLVTCPNYLFECLSWLAVVILSGGSWSAVAFFGVATCTMMLWSRGKEIRYRKEFGSSYKKNYFMIPCIW